MSATMPNLTGYDAGLPANTDAERTILGAVLLDNQAMIEASAIEADDFSLDSHRRIFLRMSSLYEAHHAIDIVTLAEELAKYKEIEQVGGVAYLASLTEGVPRRPVVDEYIKIVKDKALLRSIMAVSSSAIQRAADQSETALEVAGAASLQLERLLTRGTRSNLVSVTDFLQKQFPTPASMLEKAAQTKGVLTGITEFDEMTLGFQRGELSIVAARPSIGKALHVNCPIKTPTGWKRNGDLQVGDELASVDGQPSFVTGVFPQGDRQLYLVRFSDGRAIEADAEHLWTVYYREWAAPRMMKTSEVIQKLTRKRYQKRLWIDMVSGDFGSANKLPIHPWLLGALIGDGCFSEGKGNVHFSSADEWIVNRVRGMLPFGYHLVHVGRYDYRISRRGRRRRTTPNAILSALDGLGLAGKRSEFKFIPSQYLSADKHSRMELLRGLMDTDGGVEGAGSLVFASSSPALALGVQELARSLGAHATLTVKKESRYSHNGEGRIGLPAYRVFISHPNARELVSLPRKRDAAIVIPKRLCRLTFESITPTSIDPAQCISVSHPSALYIATNGYVVTHNTAFIGNVSERAAVDRGLTVAGFSQEMSRESLMPRFICSRGHVNLQHFRKDQLNMVETQYFAEAHDAFVGVPLHIDDTPGVSVGYIRNAIRAFKSKGPLDLVWIDHLGLMSTEGAPQKYNRAQEVGWVTRNLKALAKELDVPIVLLSQLSRALHGRGDKRPVLSDLRESGDIEQDADLVAFLHREEYYEPKEENKGKGEVIVSKQRNGPTGTAKCAYDAAITRWSDQNVFVPQEKMPWA